VNPPKPVREPLPEVEAGRSLRIDADACDVDTLTGEHGDHAAAERVVADS
jgi:hypothetical protein